jgi:hypothetical protein
MSAVLAAYRENPMYCPAEAYVIRLARNPWKGLNPYPLAAMPSEKATAK